MRLQAPSRRDDFGVENHRSHIRQRQGHDDPYRTTRGERPSQLGHDYRRPDAARSHGHGGNNDYARSRVSLDHIHICEPFTNSETVGSFTEE